MRVRSLRQNSTIRMNNMGRALVRMLFVACVVFGGVKEANAWVEIYQPFPEGEATVLVHRFCWASNCDYSERTFTEWKNAIENAATAWTTAGSDFLFFLQNFSSDANHDPCRPRDGYVYVILVDPGPLCPGEVDLPPTGVGGRMQAGPGWARIYIRSNLGGGLPHFRRLLLHEFGHVVGLGHPDEHGWFERAIMNSHLSYREPTTGEWVTLDELQPDDTAGIRVLYGRPGEEPSNPAQPDPLVGVLENPGDGSSQSGVGVISGWVCEADEVVIEFNGVAQPVAYGTERLDTQGVCGDTNNGFGLLFNWNLLGNGEHTVVALVDGVELGRATVTVRTFGEEFMRGCHGAVCPGGLSDSRAVSDGGMGAKSTEFCHYRYRVRGLTTASRDHFSFFGNVKP